MERPPSRVPSWPTSVLLLLALAGPTAFIVLKDLLFGKSPTLRVEIVSQLLYCGMAAVVLWGVIHWEHLPLTSIGIRRPGRTTLITAAILIAAALVLLPVVTAPLATSLSTEEVSASLRRLATVPLCFRVFVGICAGAVEETLYRGYAIERLATITGRRWMGAALATLAFACAHIPVWGIGFSLTADLAAGTLLALSYLWKRDLIANIVAHGTALVVAMVTVVP
jgi:membrane protease YdiL (CAAX protease family)